MYFLPLVLDRTKWSRFLTHREVCLRSFKSAAMSQTPILKNRGGHVERIELIDSLSQFAEAGAALASRKSLVASVGTQEHGAQ